MSTQRTGILAAGNFIVDHVKIIDHYPQQDMLANILGESQSNGGGPYNVLKDLAQPGMCRGALKVADDWLATGVI
jgi:hypothetical protein